MHIVYVLQSTKDNKLYIGCTSNLEKRISEHNKGLVRSTKSRTPFKLIYSEKFNDMYEAFFTERFYKSPKGKKELLEKIKHWGIV